MAVGQRVVKRRVGMHAPRSGIRPANVTEVVCLILEVQLTITSRYVIVLQHARACFVPDVVVPLSCDVVLTVLS